MRICWFTGARFLGPTEAHNKLSVYRCDYGHVEYGVYFVPQSIIRGINSSTVDEARNAAALRVAGTVVARSMDVAGAFEGPLSPPLVAEVKRRVMMGSSGVLGSSVFRICWFKGAGFSSRSHVISSKLSVCCCGSGHEARCRMLLVREALSRASAPVVCNRARAPGGGHCG